jgi:hypothetical protein
MPEPQGSRVYYTPEVRVVPRNYTEAVVLANAARDKAYRRRDEIKALLVDQQERGVRNFGGTQISVIVARRASADATYTTAIADNRWYLEYAQVYGMNELIQEIRMLRVALEPKYVN